MIAFFFLNEAVQGLIDLIVHETIEPVTVCYSLSLSSGKTITKKVNIMIRWERESSKFFTQKMDSSGDISILKYAAYFSEAISVGVLREDVDHVIALSELIKLGFLVKFNEEAVDFLMESKDLQIFLEDEELSRYASLNSILCVPFPKIFYCCIFSFYFASLLECVVSCVCSGGDVATQKESII